MSTCFNTAVFLAENNKASNDSSFKRIAHVLAEFVAVFHRPIMQNPDKVGVAATECIIVGA
jgi:hypothetical protein